MGVAGIGIPAVFMRVDMKRSTVVASAALFVGIVLVGWARPWLFEAEERVKARSSVYSLPAPAVLARLSLGYRAALADYLWAHVLVTQGLRMGERRPFPEMGDYIDAINHLEPRFREPYRLADSLMSFQAKDPDRQATVIRARGILERGLRSFPLDAELWINYGQFLAYIAPGSLEDISTRATWREEGAQALVQASSLGGHDEVTAYRTISAATILSRSGERDAAIRFLERAFTLTEDEDLKQDLLRRLKPLWEGKNRSRDVVLSQRFDQLWRKDCPFVSRAMLSVIGPPFTVWQCAGSDNLKSNDRRCDSSWSAWSERVLADEP
jgi:tetratricopeptide (TPR) repeat protein